MKILQATTAHIEPVTQLFAKYRVFYGQPFDLEIAQKFMLKRLELQDSVVFLAQDAEGNFGGFVQLYGSFTSVGVQELWILNDLYVDESYRNQGMAESLIRHAMDFSRATGRKKLILSTAHDNHHAQNLYEKIGFLRSDFYNYEILTSS